MRGASARAPSARGKKPAGALQQHTLFTLTHFSPSRPPPPPPRPPRALQAPRRPVAVRAQNDVDVDAIVKDLQTKWDGVENKTSVIVYGAGAVVLLWLASSVVSAVNAVPLLPKLLELVGLGYTAWFTYRYLLFKSAREELLADVQELKKKITE